MDDVSLTPVQGGNQGAGGGEDKGLSEKGARAVLGLVNRRWIQVVALIRLLVWVLNLKMALTPMLGKLVRCKSS